MQQCLSWQVNTRWIINPEPLGWRLHELAIRHHRIMAHGVINPWGGYLAIQKKWFIIISLKKERINSVLVRSFAVKSSLVFFCLRTPQENEQCCYSAKEMCIWGWINIRYLHADMWYSFVVFVQFFGDSFNPERLKVNFEISLLPVILMYSSKISEGKVFLSAYLPWVIGNHALRLPKIVLADEWIVYRMRWFLEFTVGCKPTRRQIVCTMYDVANRGKLMLIWIRAAGDMLKGGGPPIIIPRSQWWIPEESIVESSYNTLLRNVTISVEKGLVSGVGAGEKEQAGLKITRRQCATKMHCPRRPGKTSYRD